MCLLLVIHIVFSTCCLVSENNYFKLYSIRFTITIALKIWYILKSMYLDNCIQIHWFKDVPNFQSDSYREPGGVSLGFLWLTNKIFLFNTTICNSRSTLSSRTCNSCLSRSLLLLMFSPLLVFFFFFPISFLVCSLYPFASFGKQLLEFVIGFCIPVFRWSNYKIQRQFLRQFLV